MRILGLAALVAVLAGAVTAQDRTFVLVADARLEQSGLLKFLLPRFVLKYRIRPEIVTAAPGAVAGAAEGADVLIADPGETGGGRTVFYRADAEPAELYAARLQPGGAGAEHAKTFHDWLTGEIGRATLETFIIDGAQIYIPGTPETAVVEEVVIEGDALEGERLSLVHCGRCHVVSEKNRMGGIGSTPSFAALRAIPGWEDKFQAFWTANPHPSFTQVVGLTEPFDPNHPPHIAPVEITVEDIEAILAYAASVEPKDLGAPVSAQ